MENRPLATQWSAEKTACIDWSDADDVLAHDFSFVQMASMHPDLFRFCMSNADAASSIRHDWESGDPTAKRRALENIQLKKLLRLRQKRWCCHCGREGHTRPSCPERSVTPEESHKKEEARGRKSSRTVSSTEAAAVTAEAAENEEETVGQSVKPKGASAGGGGGVMQKYAQHKHRIERLRIVAEKGGGGGGGGPHGAGRGRGFGGYGRRGRGGAGTAGRGGGGGEEEETAVFSENRRQGVVVRIDQALGIGFVRVAGTGEMRFFLDRVDFGVKLIAVNDVVTLRVDNSRDFPLAHDLRPERVVITLDDTIEFLGRCKAAANPVRVMTMLLSHPYEWLEVLRCIQLLSERDSNSFVDAVYALVALTTFIGNREPIHLRILSQFLTQTLTTPSRPKAAGGSGVSGGGGRPEAATSPTAPSSSSSFAGATATTADAPDEPLPFCALVLRALERQTSMQVSRGADALLPDQLLEVSNYVVLVNQFTSGHPIIDEIHAKLVGYFKVEIQKGGPQRRQMENALHRRLYRSTAARTEALLIPSAADFAVPPPLPNSPFLAQNLPAIGRDTFSSVEDFIDAQCRLLRADTFESMSRLLPAVCFDLPGYEPTADTRADMDHAAVFNHVRFMGRVLTRERDYQSPESYIFAVSPASKRADLHARMRQGTAVCISTTLDRSVVSDDELFWGTVSSMDSSFIRAGMVVLSPCPGSSSFAVLQERLRRNEKLGKTDHSIMIETTVFLSGYSGIMTALSAFRGPLAMALPLAERIAGTTTPTSVDVSTGGTASAPQTPHQKPLPSPALTDGPSSSSSGGSTTKLLPYIPEHCRQAFEGVINDIRSRFKLDKGQEEVMRRLPTHEVLLVQGPPGTGKSFIGCRAVEAYVRYKQMVETGDILQKVNIDMLDGVKPGALLPHVGPVVVITYKNHALDEFLVDLLDSGLWQTQRQRVALAGGGGAKSGGGPGSHKSSNDIFPDGQRLVRIGGRSKEDRLDAFNLGALMRSRSDKTSIFSLRERISLLNERLDKLTREIHFLESGRVPRRYFNQWLTAEQQEHTKYEDREEWLRGGRFLCDGPPPTVDKFYYLTLLRPQIASTLAAAAAAHTAAATAAVVSGTAAAEATADEGEEGSPLSVFQEMRREDEYREFDETLRNTYVSAEAMRLASEPPVRPAKVPQGLQSLWSLDPVTRHEYYAFLIQSCIAQRVREVLAIMDAIKSVVTIRNHATDEVRLAVLQGADVVGLTTTGCAMNQNLLRSLRPSVLLVEEAAEVLESQLLACMTDSLCQVLLIGDHYQLKPRVETFDYEKHNQLNLSLFERLSRAQRPVRLVEQRRMHPDIADLVRPFYGGAGELVDYPPLATRPFITASGVAVRGRVPGLAKRIFFWRHAHPEEEAPGSRSKINTRELTMVHETVAHLVSQGVMQKSITIITPYLGQCKMLRSQMRLSSFGDVHVSTVDLFQGDEADIIILSLVRTEKLTEFIRMRNRLIVACSRARFAMVIVGNDALLRQSPHWRQVLEQLEGSSCVGDALPVTFESDTTEAHWLTGDKGDGSTAAKAAEAAHEAIEAET